jgi:hypothetical protein
LNFLDEVEKVKSILRETKYYVKEEEFHDENLFISTLTV